MKEVLVSMLEWSLWLASLPAAMIASAAWWVRDTAKSDKFDLAMFYAVILAATCGWLFLFGYMVGKILKVFWP